MLKRTVHLGADRRGVTAVEYALIGALVALGCAGALAGLGAMLDLLFTAIESAMQP